MPNAPEKPANAPHHRSARGGSASPVIQTIASIAINPQPWATATTRKTLARLAARPPEKSPPPQEAAASRLSPDASVVELVILIWNYVASNIRCCGLQPGVETFGHPNPSISAAGS